MDCLDDLVGMVFAINPPSTGAMSFSAFQALAIAINGTNATTTGAPPTTTDTSTATATSSASTASATPTNYNVTVGAGGLLRYDPQNITANPGDTVTFSFFPKNHTVTQAAFSAPCQPLVDTTANHTEGFSSGLSVSGTILLYGMLNDFCLMQRSRCAQ
jgi:plastocyanin